MKNKVFESIITFFAVIVCVIAIAFIMVWPLVWMWNFVMPDIFGLPEITYWQMFWLYTLVQVMIKMNVTVKNK